VRVVLQRVRRARVTVAGEVRGEIGRGALILLCFGDADGNLNLSLREARGAALVVSQFTLYGDCRKGRRPSFSDAAPGPEAESLYEAFAARLRELGVPVATGVFGAMMEVELVNEGPVTLLVESP
jgi:D-tyrosyl-tRNA(Tyr) deacylase